VHFEEPNRNEVRTWGVKVYLYLLEFENASMLPPVNDAKYFGLWQRSTCKIVKIFMYI
jgi:hypothetical protein